MSTPSAAGPSAGWGPERRRAAVAIAFEGLARGTDEHPVTPALPTLLRVLSDRDLPATFFVEAGVAASEPFALSMIDLSAHELAALADPAGGVAAARDTLAGERFEAAGARVPAGAPEPPAAEVAGLRYLAVRGAEATGGAADWPSGSTDAGAAPVRIPVAFDDAADPAPHALHLAFQAAVGQTLGRGGLLVACLRPIRFERQDALDVLVESLDLLAGLRRAERLWTPRLRELADALGG